MTFIILSDVAASITEFKANPMKVAATYEALMDKLEDMELITLAKERANEESISVSIADL